MDCASIGIGRLAVARQKYNHQNTQPTYSLITKRVLKSQMLVTKVLSINHFKNTFCKMLKYNICTKGHTSLSLRSNMPFSFLA